MQRQEMVGELEAMEVAELSKKPFGHGDCLTAMNRCFWSHVEKDL
jgi:hypothetical protein